MSEIHINNSKDTAHGEIRLNGKSVIFKYKRNATKQTITFNSINNDITLKNKVKKILNKATYCVHCGTCELECKNNALSVFPTVKINKDKCVHCLKCIDFIAKGCLKAKFISISGGKSMANQIKGFGRYFKFGMRNSWLISYLKNTDNWLIYNNLGNKQLQSFIRWLTDAELYDKKSKSPTDLCSVIKNSINNENNIWFVIWVNLYQNSHIVKWYLDKFPWNVKLSKNEVLQNLKEDFNNLSDGTLNNDTLALLNMFENLPLSNVLKFGRVEKINNVRFITKFENNEISSVSVAYSLYKYAEYKKRRNFTVSEFYSKKCDGGPYKLFGISMEKFENILRGLQEDKNQIVRVDLTANLDNIFLQDNVTSLEVLNMLLPQ